MSSLIPLAFVAHEATNDFLVFLLDFFLGHPHFLFFNFLLNDIKDPVTASLLLLLMSKTTIPILDVFVSFRFNAIETWTVYSWSE